MVSCLSMTSIITGAPLSLILKAWKYNSHPSSKNSFYRSIL
jgi:hypothetical protein